MTPPIPFPLSINNISEFLHQLDSAHQALASQSVASRIRIWVTAVSTFAKRCGSQASREIASATGFYEPDVQIYLNHLFSAYSDTNRWEDWLRREMGDLRALEIPRRRGRSVYLGLGCPRALVVQGGSIPFTALPVVTALSLVGTPVAVRLGRRDQVSFPLLLRHAARTAPILGQSILPVSFEHTTPDFVRKVFQAFPLVIAFGSNETLSEINAHITPPARFIAFGTRFSLAWVSRNSLSAAFESASDNAGSLFSRLARDILMFNKQGCYSVQGIMIESRSRQVVHRFCVKLLEALRGEFASRARSWAPGMGLTVRSSVALWSQFGLDRMFTVPSAPYPAVVLMKGKRLPPPSDGPIVWVLPVPNESNAMELLRPYQDFLSTLVVSGSPLDRLRLMAVFSSA
ncbi:MAG: acyl-CoA reductase, partial [bacterium JZ-2024 1]